MCWNLTVRQTGRGLTRFSRRRLRKNRRKIIVLDDDPTGVQTVHDISVYTSWDRESIREGFAETNSLFYVLTNSRGLTEAQTTKVHQDIAHTVAEVSKETGQDFLIISRSDSTLRGHYPLETELLKKGIEAETGISIDGEVLCPFFREGGRFTIGNVHYVKYGDELWPAGEDGVREGQGHSVTVPRICVTMWRKRRAEHIRLPLSPVYRLRSCGHFSWMRLNRSWRL